MKTLILLLSCVVLTGQSKPDTVLQMDIHISGPFSEAEAKQFVDVMRAIERKHPERAYVAIVKTTPELEGKEGEELLQRIFPPVKDRRRDTIVIQKKP
jgi:hypothetical protein